MATLKLKSPGSAPRRGLTADRAPVRGAGVQSRPTLAQAQQQRAEREARYQEQLRQRWGDAVPPDLRRAGARPATARPAAAPAPAGEAPVPRAPRARDPRQAPHDAP